MGLLTPITLITGLVKVFNCQITKQCRDSNVISILESCDWLKNPTIWLTKSILGHISRTRIFKKMKFLQAYSNYSNINFYYRPNREKIKELWKKTKLSYIYIQRTLGFAYFFHFRAKHCFQKIWLSCTTWRGLLTPCWVPEKSKEPIQRKLPNRKTERTYWYILPFWPWPGFLYKNKSIERLCCR